MNHIPPIHIDSLYLLVANCWLQVIIQESAGSPTAAASPCISWQAERHGQWCRRASYIVGTYIDPCKLVPNKLILLTTHSEQQFWSPSHESKLQDVKTMLVQVFGGCQATPSRSAPQTPENTEIHHDVAGFLTLRLSRQQHANVPSFMTCPQSLSAC